MTFESPKPDVQASGTEHRKDPIVSAIDEVAATLDGRGLAGSTQAHTPVSAVHQGRPLPFEVKRRLGFAIRLSDIPAAEREALEQHYETIQQVAAEFPSDERGLDIPRIDAYFATRGLAAKPVTVMTPSDFLEFARRLEQLGYANEGFRGLCQRIVGGVSYGELIPPAMYVPNLGRCIALRPSRELTDFETHNIAYRIAHEKAHSTGIEPDEAIVYETSGPPGRRYSRTGFHVMVENRQNPDAPLTKRNDFIYEGSADLEAAACMGWQGTPSLWRDQRTTETFQGVTIPRIYTIPDYDTRQVYTSVGAFAAYGLELIAERYPELPSALLESQTSVTGLRRVARIVEGVEPGLYSKLSKLSQTSNQPGEGLKDGLLDIARALGVNVEDPQ